MSIRIKQWKEDKNEFEIIQWNYDKSQGRSVPKKIGNCRLSWSSIPETLKKDLSNDEKEDLKVFWETTRIGRENAELAQLSGYAINLASQLKKAIERDLLNIQEIEKIGRALDDAKKIISAQKRKHTLQTNKAKKTG